MNDDWYDDFKKTCGFLDGIREVTGASDIAVLDAFFSSPICLKLLSPEPFSSEDAKTMERLCSDSDQFVPDKYPGLYYYLLLMLIAAVCKQHDLRPDAVYKGGRDSELFQNLHTYVTWYCHDDFDRLYDSFEPDLIGFVGENGAV